MTTPGKTAIRTFLSALGAGDVEKMASVLAPGATAQAMGTGSFSVVRDRETILQMAGTLRAMIPEGIDFEFISLTEEGDRAVAEVQGRSVLSDGTRYDNGYVFIARIENGKIADLHEYYCTLLTEQVMVPLAAKLAAG